MDKSKNVISSLLHPRPHGSNMIIDKQNRNPSVMAEEPQLNAALGIKAKDNHEDNNDNDDDGDEDDDEFFGNQSSSDEEEYHTKNFSIDDSNSRGKEIASKYQHQKQPFSLSSSLSMYESQSQHQKFHNLGYHEAYDEYKEHKLQLGFEEGFTHSMDNAFAIGKLLGECVFKGKYQQHEQLEQKQQFLELDGCNENNTIDARVKKEDITVGQATAASMVRQYLEVEQVKDGSNSDSKNELSQQLKRNLTKVLQGLEIEREKACF